MKFRHILAALVAATSLFAGCTEEFEISSIDGVELSSSYVGLSADGGSSSITFTSDQSWTVDTESLPDWVTVNPTSGSAGQTTISFSAEVNNGAKKSGDVKIVLADGQVQYVTVAQGGGEPGPSTCAEVLAGDNGKFFKVTGTITSIVNTHYGNWYIDDGTGEVYVYGTCDKKGNTNSSSNSWDNINDSSYANSWELSVGDVVTIIGPKTTYNGTVELVDVTIVSITKSLISVDTDSFEIGKEGGNIDVKVVYKGQDLKVTPSVDWISLANINIAADTTYVTLKVDANEGDTRTGEVELSSSIPGQTSGATISIKQATGLSMYTLPFVEDFSKGFGAFEADIVTPRPDGKDIWSTGTYNGKAYLKASAGSKVDTKSMMISPKISLNGVTSPVLSFEHCGKYCGDQAEELTVWVSADNCQTWTQLLIPNAHDNNYGWINSGDISLASFVGKEYVNFAFQYVSNTDYYGTWEIADVKVEDRAPVFTSIAALNNAASSAKVAYDVTLTDAVVKYVNGGNAFIEDATGGIQLYKSNHGLKAGQKINGKAKITVTLYNMYAEATDVDFSEATVTEDGNVDPTVLTVKKLLKDYLRYQNCFVKLEGVKFANGADGTAKVSDTLSQGEDTVASYTQTKTVKVEANKEYDVICLPTRYKTTLQVGIWEDAHLIAK